MALRVRKKKSKHKKKIRYSTKMSSIAFLGLLIILALAYLYKSSIGVEQEEKEELLYKYSENYSQDYTIGLIQNNYIKQEDIKGNNIYVSNLVKDINIKYLYNYEGMNPERINCTYKVKGKWIGKYSVDGTETQIWNKEYTYLNDVEKASNEDKLSIDENVTVDLNTYSKFMEKFIEEQQISISSVLYITFEANITAYKDGQMITDQYTNQIEISMESKIISIKYDKEDKKEQEKTQKVFVNRKTSNLGKALAIIVIIGATYFIIKINTETKVANNITNTFKMELNQILNACDDRVVRVSSIIKIDEKNVVEVKDINELVKLSEDIFRPIIYYQFTDRQEAWFCLINENESYRFILK